MTRFASTYQKTIKAALATTVALGAMGSVAPLYTKAEAVSTPSFTDVKNIPSHHFYDGVMNLASRDVIKGYEDGTFRPGQNISREHAAKIMALALGLDTENVVDPGFKDVDVNHKYYKYIAALVEAEVIKGYEDQTFRPTGNVSRAHMSQMIVLGFGFDEIELSNLPFSDVNDKQWFADFIQTLYSNEITTGTTTTTFNPQQLVTRGQLASFIHRSEMEIGGITAEDFAAQSKTTFTAGAALTEGKTLSDVDSLTAEWFDKEGKVIGKGTLTEKLATEFPDATQLSMPFNAEFNYVTDGYWTVVGSFTGEPTKVKFTVTYNNGEVTSVENTRALSGGIEAQDFGPLNETGYTAGAKFTEYQAFSDIAELTVEWFDLKGNLIGKGSAKDKLMQDFPTATLVSMPFDVNFNYLSDGYWAVEGDFTGEPTKVVFTTTFENGKQVSVENTRTASGNLIAQDFGVQSENVYSAGAELTEGKTFADLEVLSAEWFDKDGISLGKGTATDKLFEDYPEATQVSMPFDAAFDYEADGYWAVEGEFTGEPTKVIFSATFKNYKEVSVENTRN
ncbi:S-layer homology domain-containing protein [Paenisporosarcina quisquiliarum]|uniref:S-layer homology domain-containing protein n=1 Tax=Paenisporosarcina quisquiliarum TaxID=365346 RepID=UPI00373624DB